MHQALSGDKVEGTASCLRAGEACLRGAGACLRGDDPSCGDHAHHGEETCGGHAHRGEETCGGRAHRGEEDYAMAEEATCTHKEATCPTSHPPQSPAAPGLPPPVHPR